MEKATNEKATQENASQESTEAREERERMEVDVLIIGGGPAGLSCAIKLKQINPELEVTIIEKGSEIGAHIISGAVIDPYVIDELLPSWKDKVKNQKVTKDKFSFFTGKSEFPLWTKLFPPMMHNDKNYIISLGELCRFMAEEATNLGVEIYPAQAASEIIFENDRVIGVVVGKSGLDKDNNKKPSYESGFELCAKFIICAEGARGSISKQIIKKYELDKDSAPAKFGLGLKEVWEIDAKNHHKGEIKHTIGWPLTNDIGGGSFIYHFGENLISIGFVVHLDYKNPTVSPYNYFQQFKTHPKIQKLLQGGKRISYGARAISEGGYQSLPKLTFPGGALVGCAAGMVNVPRIKGTHNAMKSGVICAEAICENIGNKDDLFNYQAKFENSEIKKDLYKVRNAKVILAKFGTFIGTFICGIELWITNIFNGFSFFGTLKHKANDSQSTEEISKHKKIDFPKWDNKTSFDILTNLSFSGTNHEENQPCHLYLIDKDKPTTEYFQKYLEPALYYCPAKVYEIIEVDGKKKFQINAQNCLHCKTCDIKEPENNIIWKTPEGGGGPNYPNM